MNGLNEFMRKLFSHPSLIWKATAGLLFTILGLVILLSPDFAGGLSDMTRMGFAGLMILYGLFRLVTFYLELKNTGDE